MSTIRASVRRSLVSVHAAGRRQLHTSAPQRLPMGINASGQRDGLPIKAAETQAGAAPQRFLAAAPMPEEVLQTRRSGGRMRTTRMDAMLSHGDRIEVAAANLRRASTTTGGGVAAGAPTGQAASPPAAGASVDRGIAFADQLAGADVIEGFDESQLRPAQGVHAKPPGVLTNKGGFAGMRREDFLRMSAAAAREEATGSHATGRDFPTTTTGARPEEQAHIGMRAPEAAADMMADVREASERVAHRAEAAVATAAQAVGSAVGTAAGAVARTAGKVDLRSTMIHLEEKAVDAAGYAKEKVVDAAGYAKEKAVGAAGAVREKAGEAAQAAAEATQRTVETRASPTVAAAISKVEDAAASAAQTVKRVAADAKERVTEAAQEAEVVTAEGRINAGKIVERTKETIVGATHTVRDTARAAAEAVDTIRHAAEGAGEPGKGLQEAQQHYGAAKAELKAVAQEIRGETMASAQEHHLRDDAGKILHDTHSVRDAAGNIAGASKSAAGTLWDSVKATIRTLAAHLPGVLKETFAGYTVATPARRAEHFKLVRERPNLFPLPLEHCETADERRVLAEYLANVRRTPISYEAQSLLNRFGPGGFGSTVGQAPKPDVPIMHHPELLVRVADRFHVSAPHVHPPGKDSLVSRVGSRLTTIKGDTGKGGMTGMAARLAPSGAAQPSSGVKMGPGEPVKLM